MKMYLIDPIAGTCSHIDEDSSLETMQKLIGCAMVVQHRVALIGYSDVIYTADAAPAGPGFITPAGRHFYGKAVVIGNSNGKPTQPQIPLNELRAQVFFPGRMHLDMEPSE